MENTVSPGPKAILIETGNTLRDISQLVGLWRSRTSLR